MTQRDLESTAPVFERLARRRLLIVSGKGGVGRTTVAAMLGLALARQGRRVLVATTGHDDRLAWLLGGDALSQEPQQLGESLWVQRLAPRMCVTEFGALALRSRRLSSLVLDNPLIRRLLRAIPGLDDFAVLGKAWHEAVRGAAYDAVVFDGAASGHLRFNLGVARAIYDSVPDGPLRTEAAEVDRSLRDHAQVAAVLVGLPELWPLTELATLAGDLRDHLGMAIGALVVNGMTAAPVPVEACGRLASGMRGESAPPAVVRVARLVGDVVDRAARQHDELERWLASEAAAPCREIPRLLIPWRTEGFARRDELAQLLHDTKAEA